MKSIGPFAWKSHRKESAGACNQVSSILSALQSLGRTIDYPPYSHALAALSSGHLYSSIHPGSGFIPVNLQSSVSTNLPHHSSFSYLINNHQQLSLLSALLILPSMSSSVPPSSEAPLASGSSSRHISPQQRPIASTGYRSVADLIHPPSSPPAVDPPPLPSTALSSFFPSNPALDSIPSKHSSLSEDEEAASSTSSTPSWDR